MKIVELMFLTTQNSAKTAELQAKGTTAHNSSHSNIRRNHSNRRNMRSNSSIRERRSSTFRSNSSSLFNNNRSNTHKRHSNTQPGDLPYSQRSPGKTGEGYWHTA